jgi:hypothetical protein
MSIYLKTKDAEKRLKGYLAAGLLCESYGVPNTAAGEADARRMWSSDEAVLAHAYLRFTDETPVTDEWLKAIGGSQGVGKFINFRESTIQEIPDAFTFYGPNVVLMVSSHPVEGCWMQERDGDINMQIRSKGHARLAFKLLEIEIEND